VETTLTREERGAFNAEGGKGGQGEQGKEGW